MISRYDGRCRVCGRAIHRGDRILWSRAAGARHANATACAMAEVVPSITRPAPAPVTTTNAAPIVAFLRAAQERGLRKPKLRVLDADGHSELALTLSTRGRVPGSVLVRRDGTYLGVVRPTGEVYGRNVPVERLAEVAADPVAAATSYAALSGRCSFCNLHLTDAGSVEVGYGPVCARHWGLPHTPRGTPNLTTNGLTPDGITAMAAERAAAIAATPGVTVRDNFYTATVWNDDHDGTADYNAIAERELTLDSYAEPGYALGD